MAIADHLQTITRRFSDRTALIAGDRTWTWREIDESSSRIAGWLTAHGVQPGDRVALHLANLPELVLAYYGAFKAGAVCVPLNNRFAPAEIRFALEHSASRLVISQPELFASVDAVRREVPSLQHVVLTGTTTRPTDVRGFDELTDIANRPTCISVPESKPAAILYTSGTTSRPKGVTHTHFTLSATVDWHAGHIKLQSDDVICIVPPMCHILGFATQLIAGVYVGATLLLPADNSPVSILTAIQKHHATRLAGLPVMYQSLVNAPGAEGYQITSLRTCIAGGDAVPIALQQQFLQTFGVTLLEGCGMTEVIPFTLNTPAANRPGSIGRACPGMEIRLVDESGHDVEDEAGEIQVRSAAVMAGYWREPDLTAETLAGGWMHTGDLARRDADGYYWFVGRRKEIIIRGGSNISPLEVEDLLYRHPAVAEVGVVGAPHPELGEVVWAWIALRPGMTCDVTELREFLSGCLAAYKIPERFLFSDTLPKGLTGKINRRALREQAAKIARGDA
jgi:long-chain acyl-CoA synthetase